MLFLTAVFAILGVEAPMGAPLLFLPAVCTIMGVETPVGAALFLELLFFTIQTRAL